MEYSFSHTFGKGGIIFPTSRPLPFPPPIPNSKQKPSTQHPKIPPSSNFIKKPCQLSQKQQQLKNNRPHLWRAKTNQLHHLQRKAQMQQKIKNVDGINQRMIHLIKQFRLSQDKYNNKTHDKSPQLTNVQKCQSSKIIKHPSQNFQSTQHSHLKHHTKKSNNMQNNSNKQHQYQYKNQKQILSSHVNKYLSRVNCYNKINQMSKFVINNQSFKKSGQISSRTQKSISKQKDKQQSKQHISIKNHQTSRNSIGNTKTIPLPSTTKLKTLPSLPHSTPQKQSPQNQLLQKYPTTAYKKISPPTSPQKPKQPYQQNFTSHDQDIFSQINKISSIQQSDDDIQLCFKFSHHQPQLQSTIYLGLFDLKQPKNSTIKYQQYHPQHVLSSNNKYLNHNSPFNHFNYNRTQQINQKINNQQSNYPVENINEKIQSYQKKIQNLTINKKKQQRFQKKQQIPQKKQNNHLIPQSDLNKFTKKNQKQNQTLKIQKNIIHSQSNKQNQIDIQKKHKRNPTPTWGCNGQLKGFYQSKHQYDPIHKKSPLTQSTNLKDSLQIPKLSLPSSPPIHLTIHPSLPSISSKLIKQIQLDTTFRKYKKQLTKFVNQSKWQHLYQYYLQHTKNANISLNLPQIFHLYDEQADPFFSIPKQNLPNYQSIIKQSIQSYLTTQNYFQQNILHRFPNTIIQSIFYQSNNIYHDLIKLDHFTIIVSNTTKINYKCRDLYVLFKRISQYIHNKYCQIDQIDQGINQYHLIKLLSTNTPKQKASQINQQQPISTKKPKPLTKQSQQKQAKLQKITNETLKFQKFTYHFDNNNIKNKTDNYSSIFNHKYS